MRLFFYICLMLLLSPLFMVGTLLYFWPIVRVRGKVSGTAYEPFCSRVLYHLMGSRPDPVALQLAAGLPATNGLVMALMIKPIAWASKTSAYLPAMLQYPPPRPTPIPAMVAARCEFLDQAMLKDLAEGDQVVILGAGWDTRAYGLLKDRGVRVFEVDAPATQAVKRAAIDKTAIDASAVIFVACDFNQQRWLDALTDKGFDCNIRTFILWEGVTMYLPEEAIQDTLRVVATLPAGSTIAFDFMSREWLTGTRIGRASGRSAGYAYGEPFLFGFPVTPDFNTTLDTYLKAQGLSLLDGRPMGKEGPGELPFAGLALAEKSN
jgi:methyltransferase (TIGR00027 family)